MQTGTEKEKEKDKQVEKERQVNEEERQTEIKHISGKTILRQALLSVACKVNINRLCYYQQVKLTLTDEASISRQS